MRMKNSPKTLETWDTVKINGDEREEREGERMESRKNKIKKKLSSWTMK